ncbi:signal transduction histidine kinase [Pelistega indica]|uniref:histidine kinase n=1 Tax=Pelistega indica TaxID=1414851 RepID=V8G8Q4_9BURK|nr:nitrogen regulation protein NR(II) [Pelistega indica]ETD72451.1 signal transduction histidine kinase [Pelistega indica]
MSSTTLTPVAQQWQTFDLLLTCIIVANEAGQIEWVNSATQNLFERSRRSFIGATVASLFEDKESFQKAFDTIVKRRSVSVAFSGGIAKFESTETVNAVMHLSHDNIILELHPIEQQALSERSIRLARELEIYQETFRNLAHEVKNPLGGIRGAAQLLELELENTDHQEYTKVIIAEVDRLQQLVDRLIKPAQSGLQLSVFNIHEICERVFTLLNAEYQGKITFVRDYDASIPDIKADKAKLVQVYLNICGNAAQAILGAKEAIEQPKIILRTRILHRYLLLDKIYRMVLCLSVIDNGPGVPANIVDRVFHPLVTGRANGTGLGLSLAQELVRQHGGLIEFDTVPGRTEFRVLLPMEDSHE